MKVRLFCMRILPCFEKLGIKNKLSTLALRFKGVIKRAYEQTGQMVAILVDEYDKPMLQAIVKI